MKIFGKVLVFVAFAVFVGGVVQVQDNIIIGAALVGGMYYVWVGGLANVLTCAGLDVNVEVTGGLLHNI